MLKPDVDLTAWYLESAAWFRRMGFFRDHAALSDAELAAVLRAGVIRQYDVPMLAEGLHDPQAADLVLLQQDARRVWHEHLEGVNPGDGRYVAAVQGWAKISRGYFKPDAVREIWTDERLAVEIDLDGKTHVFRRGRVRHILDTALVREINSLIKGGPLRFESFDNLGMPDVVIALTTADRHRLLTERGWRFLNLFCTG